MPGRAATNDFPAWMQTPGPLGYNDAADPNIVRAPAVNTELDWDALRSQVVRSVEQAAWSGSVYWNAQGKPVVGFGFALEGANSQERLRALGLDFEQIKSGRQRLSQPHMLQLLEDDLQSALAQARNHIEALDDLPEEKQRAAVLVAFHLGGEAFARFRRFLDALGSRLFWEAAHALESTRLHEQLGLHGQELAALLRR